MKTCNHSSNENVGSKTKPSNRKRFTREKSIAMTARLPFVYDSTFKIWRHLRPKRVCSQSRLLRYTKLVIPYVVSKEFKKNFHEKRSTAINWSKHSYDIVVGLKMLTTWPNSILIVSNEFKYRHRNNNRFKIPFLCKLNIKKKSIPSSLSFVSSIPYQEINVVECLLTTIGI